MAGVLRAGAHPAVKAISADPQRTLIVVDPRRTESAELADIHLAVRPWTDAWLLAALLRILMENHHVDHDFIAEHCAAGELERVAAVLNEVSVADACARCGLDEALVRRTADVIGSARALATMEDLGVQMNRDSTLVSYLHRLLIVLTGSIGRPGTHFIPTVLVNLGNGESKRKSPVTGARIVGGLVPCNSIADEILTDHPKRFRAMLVEAANPAHSLADSKRMREALLALDVLVVVDVAMSETARLAHYVLPASSQFEKAEATFFNFDFPHNYFHLRRALFSPAPGTLPEAEIHARLCEALGAITEADLAPLREAAARGRAAYPEALFARVMTDPRLAGQAPLILYRTLDLPEDAREGAVVLGLALKAAMESGPSLARAGFAGAPVEAALALFDAIISRQSGVVFAVDEWPEVFRRITTPDGKIHLALSDLLDELRGMLAKPVVMRDTAFPFVLTAGERRSFTANTIIRDPTWRKKDAEGALRMNPADAGALGVSSGETVKLTTRRGSAIVSVEVSDTMQPGHVSLPNGLGLSYPDGDGGEPLRGVAPNELTATEDRDPFVGTPWHKNVAARVERVKGAW